MTAVTQVQTTNLVFKFGQQKKRTGIYNTYFIKFTIGSLVQVI